MISSDDNETWLECKDCHDEFNKLIDGRCYTCDLKFKNKISDNSYLKKTFENFKMTKNNEEAFHKAVDFVSNDKGLYMWGSRGLGKTHLAYAAYNNLRAFRKNVILITVPDLLLELRSTFDNPREMSEREVVERYSTPDYLILDDMGAEKVTDFTVQAIYLIIDRREKAGNRKLLITSEKPIGDIAENLDDRISSRICGMCEIVGIKGKDRRVE